jgi:hypothetical protein
MQDANLIAAKRLSAPWRAVCLFVIVVLEILLVWRTVTHILPERDSWLLLFSALATATLVASGYDIATKGRLTRLAFWFWLPPFVCGLARDINRVWNHDPNIDPFFRLLVDAGYIFMVITWILADPFGPKKGSPAIIKKEFT